MDRASEARWHRLSPKCDGHGIYCGIEGAFVGSVPLLRPSADAEGSAWCPRSLGEIDVELAAAYGLPVDFSAKRAGLAVVARALNGGDIATAQATMLNLRLPDIPALATGGQEDEKYTELIVALYLSELLPVELREQVAKFDSRLHPRWPAGTENSQGGQFRPRDGDPILPVADRKDRATSGAPARDRVRIPHSVTLPDGSTARITFMNDRAGGPDPDQAVARTLRDAVVAAVRATGSNLTINSTVSDRHRGPDHPQAYAVDIDIIDGRAVRRLGPDDTRAFQDAAASNPDVRLVCGPAFCLRRDHRGGPLVPDAHDQEEHRTHVHISVFRDDQS